MTRAPSVLRRPFLLALVVPWGLGPQVPDPGSLGSRDAVGLVSTDDGAQTSGPRGWEGYVVRCLQPTVTGRRHGQPFLKPKSSVGTYLRRTTVKVVPGLPVRSTRTGTRVTGPAPPGPTNRRLPRSPLSAPRRRRFPTPDPGSVAQVMSPCLRGLVSTALPESPGEVEGIECLLPVDSGCLPRTGGVSESVVQTPVRLSFGG